MMKSTLTIATSVFLLISGAADLFAMDDLNGKSGKQLVIAKYEVIAPAPINYMLPEILDDNSGKQLVIAKSEDTEPGPINHMPKDVTEYLLNEIIKDVNPRCLTPVCKSWYSFIREADVNADQIAELHYSATNILHLTMNPFMKKCMHTYWDNLFYNGNLRYTPTDGGQAVSLKFSDLKDGTFDLSKCGDAGKYLVITENIARFFNVGEDKTLVGIMPCHRVLQEIKDLPEHPFFPLKATLDPDKASVLLFWRDGDNTNLKRFDYLITASVRDISSRNLYENWVGGRVDTHVTYTYKAVQVDFISIFEPK
jgi:hypothetical protein